MRWGREGVSRERERKIGLDTGGMDGLVLGLVKVVNQERKDQRREVVGREMTRLRSTVLFGLARLR